MTLLKGMVHQVSSSAPGTGDVSLPSTAATGGRTTFLAAFGTGNPCYYYLENDSGSEWGEGTITGSSTATLTRDTVIGNSDGTTSKINFTGVVNAWSGIPAERALYLDATKTLSGQGGKLLAINSVGDAIEPVDAPTNALDWKASVRVATTASGTLASDFENGDSIDGVTLATGDRILIKSQSSASENGIYVVAASGAPSRAVDFDEGAEVTSGAATFVEEGTANGGIVFILTTTGTITVGTTDLVFSKLSTGGSAAALNLCFNPSQRVNQKSVSGTVTLSSGEWGHDGLKAGSSGATYTFASSGGVTVITISAGSLIETIYGVDLESADYIHAYEGTVSADIDGGGAGISGQTVSATAGTDIEIEYGTGTLSRRGFYRGTIAPAWELPDLEVEKNRCRTRYRRIRLKNFSGYSGSSGAVTLKADIVPPMTAAPTITRLMTSFSAASFDINVGGSWVSNASISDGLQAFDDQVYGNISGFSGLTVGANAYGNSGSDFVELSTR